MRVMHFSQHLSVKNKSMQYSHSPYSLLQSSSVIGGWIFEVLSRLCCIWESYFEVTKWWDPLLASCFFYGAAFSLNRLLFLFSPILLFSFVLSFPRLHLICSWKGNFLTSAWEYIEMVGFCNVIVNRSLMNIWKGFNIRKHSEIG